jgi:hypothetical protein
MDHAFLIVKTVIVVLPTTYMDLVQSVLLDFITMILIALEIPSMDASRKKKIIAYNAEKV